MGRLGGKESSIQPNSEAAVSRPVPAGGGVICPGGQTATFCCRHLYPSVPLPILGGSLLWPGGFETQQRIRINWSGMIKTLARLLVCGKRLWPVCF